MPYSLQPHGLHPHQVPLSMGFSRQGNWSSLPFPSPGDLLTQGLNPGPLHHRQILYQLRYQGCPWITRCSLKRTNHEHSVFTQGSKSETVPLKLSSLSTCLSWLVDSFSDELANTLGTSLVAQTVKNLPTVQETWVRSLVWEDPLEKGMTTHSSILVWRIPWTEEPGELQSMGLQRVIHNWATNTHTHGLIERTPELNILDPKFATS